MEFKLKVHVQTCGARWHLIYNDGNFDGGSMMQNSVISLVLVEDLS